MGKMNMAKANKAVAFIEERLTFVEGEKAGQPFKLERWQKEIIRTIFGMENPDGTRTIRKVFIGVPRKNGKSPLAAAIALTLLLTDAEQLGQIYIASGGKEQTGAIWRPAKAMVQKNQLLSSVCEVMANSIVYRGTGSFLQILSSTADTKHGLNANGIFIDELHIFPDRELHDVLVTATGTRRQPLIVYTTTAGANRQSICYEIYEYAKKVQAGIIKDETFLPVIYEASDGDDISSEKVWKKANPGLGTIVKKAYIQQAFNETITRPSSRNNFMRLHLNMWVTSETRWINDEVWQACDHGKVHPEGAPVILGLDLSATRDITAICMAFPDYEGHTVLDWRFFVPSETFDGSQWRNEYLNWERDGYLVKTEGNVVDYDRVKEEIVAIASRNRVMKIGYDPYMAQFLIPQLTEAGFDCVPVGQGIRSMAPATKSFEQAVYKGEINHQGNPVARWMLSNCMIYTDPNGNMKVNKAKSTGKVDGIIAAIICEAIKMDGVEPPSVYELTEINDL